VSDELWIYPMGGISRGNTLQVSMPCECIVMFSPHKLQVTRTEFLRYVDNHSEKYQKFQVPSSSQTLMYAR